MFILLYLYFVCADHSQIDYCIVYTRGSQILLIFNSKKFYIMVDDSWDIEKYKTFYESDEHWELRKRFILTHKSDIPEDELVCLAQVFTNVEILGCR